MPKAEIPANYARVAQHGTYGPSSWVNVFYLHVPTPGSHTPSDIMIGVTKAIEGLYVDAMQMVAFPVDWVTTYCTVTYRDNAGSINRARIADAHAGTGADHNQDAQVSYLINWSTDDARKGGKPRQYITGVVQAAVADSAHLFGGFTSGRFVTLNAWLVNIQDASTYAPFAMHLVDMSFIDGKAFRTTPVAFPISLGSINPVVASQRRRVDRLRPV